jgi:hypothetical protein
MLKTNNLVSAYRFENSGTCWAASGRNITVYGAAYADGKFGRCLSFDGVDDYGQFSSAYNFGVGHTICLWANFHNSSSNKYFLGDSIYLNGICYNNANFSVYIGNTSNTTLDWENTQTWAHVTIVRDSAKIYNFYINGVYLGQCNSNTAVTLSISYIGRRRYSAYFFKGSICELQFYNTKLSTENIRRVMLGLHPF